MMAHAIRKQGKFKNGSIEEQVAARPDMQSLSAVLDNLSVQRRTMSHRIREESLSKLTTRRPAPGCS